MKGVNDIGNGVTCFEEYNVAYHRSKSIATAPPPGRNGLSSLISPAYSSNVAISKSKVLPNSIGNYSHCSDGFISGSSLRKSKSFFSDPQNNERVKEATEALNYKNLVFNSMGQENITTLDASAEENKFSKALLKAEAITNGVPERVKRKRLASFMDFSPQLYPRSRDCDKPDKFEWSMNELRKEKASDEKREEISDSVKEGSVQGSHLTPDDVLRVIGPRLFQKARHTILDQQKTFSGQILELHRLIKVQRHMARSPENPPEKNFHAKEPPIISPSMDKRLVHYPPKIPMTRTMIPSTNAKIVPPYVSQWLVPIKSPYEGPVYNRFPGPSFPSDGLTFWSEFGQSYVRNLGMATDAEEPVEKDGLALFPMTPSGEVSKGENDGPKSSGVVKVVPHNRNLAPESAARIFESLKEERRVLGLSSCT